MNARTVNFACALACFGLVAYALYTQHYQGQDPCPLCMFQRVGIIALGIVFTLAALAALAGSLRLAVARSIAVLIGLTALATAAIAIRHLYIQSLPEGSVPVCGATLDYMIDVFPMLDVIRKVLTGSGECARITWQFLGLAMPAWVLIWSLLLGAVGATANWRRAV
ncbi:MAG: disulfide bond formation protein B [Steroidobacteraceae bacterium]